MTLSRADDVLLAEDCPYHINIVYRSDGFLVSNVGTFLYAALARGGAAIAIATGLHLDGLARELAGRGLDLTALRREERYFVLDAVALYERFTTHGVLDEERAASIVRDILDRARWATRPVSLYGEVVGLFAERHDLVGAARLEDLWDLMLEERPHAALCGYPGQVFRGATQRRKLQMLCAWHKHTIRSRS
ncbi:MAG: MEDS domain-containing protein [Acidobacteriota bacterium]